ncbi:TPM domain-containing protein [Kushneria sp. AK178]
MPLTRSLAAGLLLLLCTAAAQAAPDFPELTGRVVDNAELLDASTETQLAETLAAHEEATSEQVVVVTLPDLGGETIEQYGYQLGREWGIGQEGEDNGALLIVALDERQVRIEVGYGLEGRLTDARSSQIINQIMTPAFSDGDFARGIVEGSQAMIQVLGGDPMAQSEQRSERASGDSRELGGAGIWLSIMMFIVLMIVRGGGRGGGGLLGGMLLGGMLGGGGRSGGGLGGGGFSGGGGGFGGGGASGDW